MNSVPLGELGNIVSGSTPKTHVADYWDGEIPWVTPADLSAHEGIYFQGRPKGITQKGLESCSAKMLPPGSILFSSRAPIGHCAVTRLPLCTNQGFKCIVPNKLLHPVYGYFALKFVTPSIIAQGRGATFAEINKEIMEEVRIPYRDIAEQRQIAGQLEQADRLRRTRRYALELSDNFLTAVFLELFGNSLCGRNHWPLTTLGELVRNGDKLNYGVVQPGDDLLEGVPIIRVADLDDLQTSTYTLKRIAPEIEKNHSASRLVGDEILIACVGSIGKIAKVTPRVCGFNIARAVARVRCNWSRIDRDFLEHYLRSSRAQDFFVNETRTSSQPTLNITQIEETPVIEPPLVLQQKFASIVERHERLRATQREALRQAEHLFQTLLHQAFSEGMKC